MGAAEKAVMENAGGSRRFDAADADADCFVAGMLVEALFAADRVCQKPPDVVGGGSVDNLRMAGVEVDGGAEVAVGETAARPAGAQVELQVSLQVSPHV